MNCTGSLVWKRLQENIWRLGAPSVLIEADWLQTEEMQHQYLAVLQKVSVRTCQRILQQMTKYPREKSMDLQGEWFKYHCYNFTVYCHRVCDLKLLKKSGSCNMFVPKQWNKSPSDCIQTVENPYITIVRSESWPQSHWNAAAWFLFKAIWGIPKIGQISQNIYETACGLKYLLCRSDEQL